MSSEEQIDEVLLSFTPVQSSVTLHQPVFLDFSIHNGLAEAIHFDLGHNRKSAFDVMVTEPDGSIGHATPLSDWGLGLAGDFVLNAAEVFRQRLLLNERYVFNAPGNYTVDVRLTTPITNSLGIAVEPRLAPPFKFTVQPRDPIQLEQICLSLAQIAIESSDVEKAMDAGLALSYVIDPVAVPYLKQVLNHSRLAFAEAALGLGRIANEDAIEALIEALMDPSSLAPSKLFSVLNRVKEATEDPEIKSRIKKALASLSS